MARAISPFFNFRIPSIFEEDEWQRFFVRNQGLEVYETENEVVVKAPVPGVKPEDIDVTFEDGVLRISGKSEEKQEEKEKRKVIHTSAMVTAFDYTTTLPRAIEVKSIKAEVENGVITVTASIAPEAKPKKIAVTAKGK